MTLAWLHAPAGAGIVAWPFTVPATGLEALAFAIGAFVLAGLVLLLLAVVRTPAPGAGRRWPAAGPTLPWRAARADGAPAHRRARHGVR